jgi:serine/threonine protein kinase
MTSDRERDGLLPGTAPASAPPRLDQRQLPPDVPAIGEVIADKYRVERVLGAGGMGVVVAAQHLQLDTRVALKFLLPGTLKNPDAAARFSQEARAAVRITNEHVARVLDVGTLGNGHAGSAPCVAGPGNSSSAFSTTCSGSVGPGTDTCDVPSGDLDCDAVGLLVSYNSLASRHP